MFHFEGELVELINKITKRLFERTSKRDDSFRRELAERDDANTFFSRELMCASREKLQKRVEMMKYGESGEVILCFYIVD